jgi:hypothetical protein
MGAHGKEGGVSPPPPGRKPQLVSYLAGLRPGPKKVPYPTSKCQQRQPGGVRWAPGAGVWARRIAGMLERDAELPMVPAAAGGLSMAAPQK